MRASALLAVGISVHALKPLVEELLAVADADEALNADVLDCYVRITDALAKLEAATTSTEHAEAFARIRDLAWALTMSTSKPTALSAEEPSSSSGTPDATAADDACSQSSAAPPASTTARVIRRRELAQAARGVCALASMAARSTSPS